MSNLVVATEQSKTLSAYEVRRLVEHLALIEGQDDMRRLMTMETNSGRNYWYELKLEHGLIDSYFDDLRVASEIEERAIASLMHNSDTNLSYIVLYAGMRSSLVQRVSNVPPALLHQFAVRGIWSPERCFRYALSQTTPERRCNALCAIFPVLNRAARQACFEQATESIRQLDRAAGNDAALDDLQQNALRQLCEVLVRENELPLLLRLCEMQADWVTAQSTAWMLAEHLANVCSSNPERCAKTVRHLLQATTAGVIMVAPAAYGLLTEVERQHVWTSLQSHIGEDPFFVHHLIKACLAIARWKSSAEMKEAVDPLYAQILRETIEDVRITHLVNLLPLLDADSVDAVINDALDFVSRRAANDLTLEDIVSKLCDYDPTSWNEIRAAVRSIPNGFLRWKVMATAVSAFPHSEAQRELTLAFEYIASLSTTDAFSAEVLLESVSRLAPKMERRLLERFRDLILITCSGKAKIRSLSSLSSSLNLNELQACTVTILETPIESFATTREEEVARFFEQAAPYMNEPLLRDSLHRLETRRGTIFSEGDVANMLKVLQKADKHDLLVQAFREISTLPIGEQANLLRRLPPYVADDDNLQRFAVSTAMKIADEQTSASILCDFAREISDQSLVGDVRQNILKTIEKLTDPRSRAEVIARAIKVFSDLEAELYGQLIESIQLVPHPTNRAQILAELPNNPAADRLRHTLIDNVLANEGEAVVRDVLRELAPVIPRETVELTLSHFRLMRAHDHRFEATPALARRMMYFGLAEQAFNLVAQQQHDPTLADGIEAIAYAMDRDLLDRAYNRAQTISNSYSLDLANSAICVRAAELGLVQQYFEVAVAIARPEMRARTLLKMAKEPSELKTQLLEHGMKAASLLNPTLATSVTLDIQAALLNCLHGDQLVATLADLIKLNGEQERAHFVGRVFSLGEALRVAGGATAIAGSVAALQDICRWWP